MSSSRLLGTVALAAISALACGSSKQPAADGGAGAGGTGGAARAGSGGTGDSGTGAGGATGGSGGNGAGDGAQGAAIGLGCIGIGLTRCTQPERDAWNQCVFPRCEAEFKACHGPGIQTGNFSGPCATHSKCVSKCVCNDVTCFLDCGLPPAACATCTMALQTCQNGSGCPRPACLLAPDGGVSDVNCDDLMRCCAAIADPSRKALCEASYNQATTMGVPSCRVFYAAFRRECP